MKKFLFLCLFTSILVGAPRENLVNSIVRRNKIIRTNQCLVQAAQGVGDCVVGCIYMNLAPIAAAITVVVLAHIWRSAQIESGAL